MDFAVCQHHIKHFAILTRGIVSVYYGTSPILSTA